MKYFNARYNPVNLEDSTSIKVSKIVGVTLSGKTIEIYSSTSKPITSFYSSIKESKKEYRKILKILSKNEKINERKKYFLQKLMIKNQYVNDEIEIIDLSEFTNFDEDNEEEENNVQ